METHTNTLQALGDILKYEGSVMRFLVWKSFRDVFFYEIRFTLARRGYFALARTTRYVHLSALHI